MPDKDIRYYRNRESQARASAYRATDPLAIKIHLQLAEEYAKAATGEVELRSARQRDFDDVLARREADETGEVLRSCVRGYN